ncbi:universal stress protein [Massilia sp. UMI-21]|nr:universal stress protein [Massilia sp. UMI-21]
MTHELKILAAVSQSVLAGHVADYAAWAATRLAAPLELLHVLERHPERAEGADRSGAIGVDAQEALLSKLATQDEHQARLLREQGRLHLNRLRERVLAAGTAEVDVRQRHGSLEDTLAELGAQARLVVMGRHAERPAAPDAAFERVIRALRTPVLAVPGPFREPRRVMLAFDGGIASRRAVDLLAGSTLFHGSKIDLLMSGKETFRASGDLEWARRTFEAAGVEVDARLAPGNAGEMIARAIKAASTDLLVMGAYSHSPLRSLLFGSRTRELLRAFSIPALLMR